VYIKLTVLADIQFKYATATVFEFFSKNYRTCLMREVFPQPV